MTFQLVRVVEHKVEERSLILDTLRVVENLDQERDVVVGHFPADRVLNQSHSNHPGQVPVVAHVFPLRDRRPDSQAGRRYEVEEAEFAVEQEFGEARSWEWRAVEVCKAESVRVAVSGGEVSRCFLTVMAFSRGSN